MAKTYSLIQSQTLTSTVSTIEFTNIPQNYTDLLVLCSIRSNRSDSSAVVDQYYIRLNGSNNSNSKVVRGNGSSASSSDGQGGIAPTSLATANTFSNDSIYIPNYTSSNNKIITVDSVMENNGTESWLWLCTALYGSAAVTSVSFAPNAGTGFVSGSKVTLYGIGAHRASGGTITSDANFTYHTFTSSGTFTALEKIKNAEVLCIAGGGGGGSRSGGGGGAGGVTANAGLTLIAGTSYSAIIGAGGAGGARNIDSTNGANSNFITFSATGGGGGASAVAQTNAGRAGGSGGGGCNNFPGGAGVSGQGFAGGNSNGTSFDGAGGGGAGAIGQNATAGSIGSGAGNGGIGTNAYVYWANATNTGVSGFYAGGGGAGSFGALNNHGKGGLGGGGNGADTSPTAGTANTGGGGGGCGNSANTNTTPIGASGGSGLIIIRYPN